MLLPIASLWRIRFLEGAADALRWAHCISECCCQWLHFGTLNFKVLPMHSDGPITFSGCCCCCQWLHFGPSNFKALPMHSDGPIALADAAADAFRWADCISRCCCQWLCFGPLFFLEALLMP